MITSAIVPLKYSSRRLPNKNFLMLGTKNLASHIFSTLLKNPKIDHVFCYSSDPKMLDLLPSGVEFINRPKDLDGDEVRANELFRYAVNAAPDGLIVLTQVPSPFLTNESINSGIVAVTEEGYDSAFSAIRHQTYCWMNGKALNYDRKDVLQTQNITPVYAETSGFYIFNKGMYLETDCRIGSNPKIIEVSYREGVDIDEYRDLKLARALLTQDIDSDQPFSSTTAASMKPTSRLVEGVTGVKHFAFDMDGVLIDSLEIMSQAWAVVCDKYELEIPFDEYKKLLGFEFGEILEKLNVPMDLRDSVANSYNAESISRNHLISVYSGITELLDFLKRRGLSLSVVTSKPAQRTNIILEKFFPNVFDSCVTPEQVGRGRGKPHPDQLILACVQVGVSPKETVYLGDMNTDRITAREAGTGFVYAGWGFEGLANVEELWFPTAASTLDFVQDHF